MFVDSNVYMLQMYAAYTSDFLNEGEWRAWADVLIELSEVPKRWVVEMAVLSEKNTEFVGGEISREIKWSDNLYSLKGEFELSFLYIKGSANDGDEGFYRLAVGNGYFSDAPIDNLVSGAKSIWIFVLVLSSQ